MDGKIIKVSDFADRVIILNIWETWCGPCRAEMPRLDLLYEKFRDRIVFLSISQESLETLKGFSKKEHHLFPIFRYEKNQIPSEFRPEGFPTTFILDSSGKIVFKLVGAADWGQEKTFEFLNILLNKHN